MVDTPTQPPPPARREPTLTRRTLVAGGCTLAAGAVAGAAYSQVPPGVLIRLGLADRPDFFVPAAPEGRVRLETVTSVARGRVVQLFTAVPQGFGDGAGLPVLVVLHGATARATDYRAFGFGRFLTAAVRRGAAPFVVAGADGGPHFWAPDPATGDDPQRMLLEELPTWLDDRGFDGDRRALWGWSMGGYGSLRAAQVQPGWARAVAAFSPAVAPGDDVFADVDALTATPLGIWCGTDDPFYDATRALVATLPRPPAVAEFSAGAHTRVYWSDHTLRAFAFVAEHLRG